ncbi:MAG: efflux RND transporter periplasmic adaptor subunit [Prevotella sp.]|jgi:RND family efflux transporter MFP subunit|nr:efflux RND transporter periplasmic adaptor subunit [Prevotella sp.]MCH4018542.1 efflux RND transporter periplasmic adaptor subunit [Prevotella sp.]MCH4100348.1 efflux RND transporter periplasmic adaptor subunit [Prevotella sp.]MCI1325307.1 efflux RND transporter periplasmic adaptor subunit [Prevotella sp.]MCI1350232.1 efflux RND transporter periplasmic adaptor subunit [Prevotella sp.]MCI1415612.1 efflux RND transporter periplasmic adaptor subunit [Prevotella sp.]
MKIRIFPYLILIGILTSCASRPSQKKKTKPIQVQTYYPTSTNSEGMSVSGMVSAKQTAMISTKVMGYITKINVQQGDVIHQGQTLVIINSSDLQAQEAQARALIAEASASSKDAQHDYQRYQTLHEQKSVSDKELENIALKNISAKARLQMARQGLQEVRSMLAYTHIRAPFTGVVTQKMVDEGSIATPGMPLLAIEQSGNMEITASVPESYITSLHLGDPVKVAIKSVGLRINGAISELSPSAVMTGGQYEIKISIGSKDKAKLRAGMYASIYIPSRTRNGGMPRILIKKSSIITKDQLTGVYVADKENKAILHWIRLGNTLGDQVEVLSGLNSDDRVIENTNRRLYNGQNITVTN